MTIIELLLLSASLAMDAFAVSVCVGITERTHALFKAFKPAGLFAAFQFIMPVLGYYLGSIVAGGIGLVGQYIAALLLAFIGGRMIWGARKDNGDNNIDSADVPKLLLMAVATSIDALATGITFSFLNVNVWVSSLTIGGVTFIICLLGYYLGKRIGVIVQKRATIAGGAVLMLLGAKILIESLV